MRIGSVAEAEALMIRSFLAPFSLSVCSPPTQHWHPHPRGEIFWSKRSLSRCLVWVRAWVVVVQAPVRVPDCSWCAACISVSSGCPHPIQILFKVWVSSVPQNCALSSATTDHVLVWSYATEQKGPEWVLSSDSKPARVLDSFNLLPLPCFVSKQVCAHSSWAESRFLTAFLLISLVFSPSKGTVFPVSDSRVEVPNTWLKLLTSLWGSPSLCNPPPLLWRLPGAQVPTWSLLFPSYVIPPGSFSQFWLYKSLSASLHFIFSENFSTCRCIFDVFIGGSELHGLLFHGLDVLSKNNL